MMIKSATQSGALRFQPADGLQRLAVRNVRGNRYAGNACANTFIYDAMRDILALSSNAAT